MGFISVLVCEIFSLKVGVLQHFGFLTLDVFTRDIFLFKGIAGKN